MSITMTTPTSMTDQMIDAVQARQQLGELLDKTEYRGEVFIIQRAGKPKAALVPLRDYHRMQQARNRMFSMVDKLRAGFADMSGKEIDKLVDEAVTAVRAEEAAKKT